jgi:hypothetical protein
MPDVQVSPSPETRDYLKYHRDCRSFTLGREDALYLDQPWPTRTSRRCLPRRTQGCDSLAQRLRRR